MENVKLFNGDCLEKYEQIDRESVDLILVDPPYGNMKTDGGERMGISRWDNKIPPQDIFKLTDYVLREGGRLVLFSQEPYTSELTSAIFDGVFFSQKAVWVKEGFANHLGVNKNMVSRHEDILVFTKRGSRYTSSPVKHLMKKYTNRIGKEKIIELFEREGRYSTQAAAKTQASYMMGFSNGRRFDMLDEKMFNYLKHHIPFQETYQELREIHESYKSSIQPTFNTGEKAFVDNVFEYPREKERYHPTQKPIKLLERLISIYSNMGDTVLDFTMGSGSTGVACKNTDRRFIGIELDKDYFDIAKKRIEDS